MSSYECPPTPPTLPEGDAAITPPPKSPPRSSDDDSRINKNPPKNGGEESKRPKSPEPSCAICLGKLENMSHTNACMHKFCFVCLVEWTKVKPECPLCKRKISSIIHNIQDDGNSDSYTLPPQPPREDRDIWLTHEGNRRFQYRLAEDHEVRNGHNVMREIIRERQDWLRMEQMRAIQIQMDTWRDQLPTMLPSSRPNPSRISASTLWTRRRGAATSEFRRDIYRRNLYVDPESISDITGRVRESSPIWYRTNTAQTHRLVPWLNRELNALLENQQVHQSAYVTQKILQWIERFEIRSPEFHEKLLPFLGTRTDHFQHEFYHYARSVYDLIGYDRNATYTEQAAQVEQAVLISSEDEIDDVIVVDEVRPTEVLQSPASPPLLTPTSPPPEATSIIIENPFEMGPSTSTGISSSAAPLQRLVIPDSESDDDTDHGNNKPKPGDVEIVGYVKPRHERTPVIIDLSSEDDKHLIGKYIFFKLVVNNN